MFRKLRLFFAKPNHFFWHECHTPFLGGRDIDGAVLIGRNQIQRRLTTDGDWQYRQPSTEIYEDLSLRRPFSF
jgi:hypothetical protein